jgi:hypothetical protein
VFGPPEAGYQVQFLIGVVTRARRLVQLFRAGFLPSEARRKCRKEKCKTDMGVRVFVRLFVRRQEAIARTGSAERLGSGEKQ